MSVLETPRDAELSLPEFLTDRARHSSDARLAADAGIGFVVAIAAVLWSGPGWILIASAAVCFLAYGVWGIADRELLERGTESRAGFPWLKLTRVATAIAGFGAALTLIIATLFIALGRIIS